MPFVEDTRVLMRDHGRYLFAEVFVQPNEQAPGAVETTRQVRAAILPLDWRFQHVAVELTDDLETASNVLTREELEIEAA